jgi:spore maturation protein CgeB
MKIIYFAEYYPAYLESFLKNFPLDPKMSYQEMLDAIGRDYFSSYISYTNYSRKLGLDAILIIANCEPLQKQWAKENGFGYRADNWKKEIAIAQIKAFKPDIFYMASMFEYYGPFLELIRPYCQKLTGWISCPIPSGLNLSQLTLIFSSLPSYVENFRKMGINSELVSAGFDPEILSVLPKEQTNKIPLSFVGSLSMLHLKRLHRIKKVLEKRDMQIWGNGIENLDKLMRPRFVPKTLFKTKAQKSYRGEAWGLQMYRVLQQSKITFNAHIDIAGDYGVNMRMYEATGVGTLLLTDGTNSKYKSFEDGKEVVYYHSVEDAIEKIDYYLTHEEERKQIANAGQNKTLKQYSYHTITQEMIGHFQKIVNL